MRPAIPPAMLARCNGTARNPQTVMVCPGVPGISRLSLSPLSSIDSLGLSGSAKRDRRSIRFDTHQIQGLTVGNVGGNRNYGYGKQLAWAGKNALLDRYGQGHFSTRARDYLGREIGRSGRI